MKLRNLRHSLVARLIGISLLLLLAVQLAGFAVVRASIERNARVQITRELDTDERVWRRLLEQKAERLRQGSALLAADYGFRSAVSSDDVATIESALGNHGARIGAAVTVLLDTQLALRVVSSQAGMGQLPAALAQVVPALAAEPAGSQITVIDGLPHQFVMVPLRAPLVIGWVLMGFPVGQPLADEMRQLLSADVALRVGDGRGGFSVPVSTLGPQALAQLRASAAAVNELELEGGDTLLVRASPLSQVGVPSEALLLRSVDAVLAPYRQLQWLLAVITAAGVLLFALGSSAMARRVTTPLRSLLGATRRLSRGDYSVPMEHTARSDEVGDLARSFDHMRIDISHQQAEIRDLAYRDRLTGLPNRERFRGAVLDALRADALPGHCLAVLMLDLDRFKHVNDVLGYAFGDRLLQAVASRLQPMAGTSGDMVARHGGNEFALLLHVTDAQAALRVAERIAGAFETPIQFDDQTVDLSASMGIALWPEHAQDADMLLNRAEIAMYGAKKRLSVVLLYDPALDSSSAQTLSLLGDLRRALEHGELRLYLQPKVALQAGGGVAAEALLRWQHPQRGLVPPMEFIPFAEQTGFVRHLTLWVFEQVAALLGQSGAREMALRVSVNLSTRDLLDPDLSLRLGAILARYAVDAGSFCLEITESAIMDDPQRAEAMLNRLAQQGFKLSIDDFGTGYSSLAYLKRLPVNELKIDKSFVLGMQSGGGDAQIVRSTIDLAHNLGLTVVAEGVEDAALMERLRAMACDEAQGYHISRPMPADQFFGWHAGPGAAFVAAP
ncbi:MAG: EAL domain-containing protein [Simplicispira suum]|uniref:putative bifunctional diguanylate cyclase/phosphodiesterase n=1 Tax=Simplicispira suum TaxID=2109915 RepID=UPI001C6BCDDE|nr:EAL domain-containing protein [Simplicispira suum]MBW7833739.1 EAL domain-containing protein [Simplicispira suum]